MSTPIDEDRAARIRQARQVLAGSDVRPPDDSYLMRNHPLLGGSLELRYFIGLAVLALLSALVWTVADWRWASPLLIVLALALIAAWFVL